MRLIASALATLAATTTTALAAAMALAALVLATSPAAGAAAVCERSPAAAPSLARLRDALSHGRFGAYQPTALSVTDGRVTGADPQSIRADLTVLRPRFDSLITYDAIHGAESIPAIAAALKYRALVIGVWNPLDETEVSAASEAARRYPKLVVGVSLGNELLFARRNDPAALGALIARVRAALPQTPLSISEPFHIYYQDPVAPLLGQLDFLIANVHPVFQPWFRDAPDANAAQFVANVVTKLAGLYCGPVLVKETGVPTAPADALFSEARQASFYQRLRERLPPTRERAFAYFAAFDAPWRAYDAIALPGAPPGVHPEEAHWGLYGADRHPKQAARELPALTSPPKRP
jgi:exo-beta-1,3-glucanase (GH17 family)